MIGPPRPAAVCASGPPRRPPAEVLRFDPVTSSFTPLPGLLVPRSLLTGAVLPDDRLVMSGGLTGGDECTPTGEICRPGRARVDGERRHSPGVPTVSRLPGGRRLIVGGNAPDVSAVSSVLIHE